MDTVFLSYSSRDKESATKLAGQLRDMGFDVWLDEWRLHVGHSIPAEIGRALTDASYLIVLLSPHSTASNWVEREWQAAYWSEVESGRVVVLPVLLEPCTIPALLRAKKYASLAPDFPAGVAAIADSINFHARAAGQRAFYAPAERLWREELSVGDQVRAERNAHWDDFARFIGTRDDVERRRIQCMNSLNYLEQFGLTVRQLKNALKDLGFYTGPLDDSYGSDVSIAVENFQSAYNLRHVDGVFGPMTYLAMAQVSAQRRA